MTRLALSILVLAVFAACGDDTNRRVQGTDTADVSFAEVSFDVEIAQETITPPDFGDPCNEAAQCVTGHCVQGPDGFVCSMGCSERCPVGWSCLGVQTPNDIAYVCVPNGDPPDTSDTSASDTSPADTTPVDTTTADTTPSDTGPTDTTVTDTGPSDTGPTDTTSPDTTQPPLGNACDAPPGVGSDNLLAESQVSRAEWPDCISGDCFEVNPNVWVVDLRSSSFTGAMGTFDTGAHTYEFNGGTLGGPDIDIVAIKAPPRTMVELAVVKATAASLTDPLIYVHDGFGIRTFGGDVSDGNTCARTTIGFPFVSDLPIYAVIEETTNYDRWSPNGYLAGTVGGSSYGWILRVRTAPWVPVDLGSLAVNQVLTLDGGDVLTVGGETRYYRFYAPGTSKPRVTVTRRSGAGFDPAIGGMKTIEGELVWQRAESDGDGNGVVVLPSNGMRPCIPQSECPAGFSCPPNLCTAGQVEWVFAVFDYNGAAAPGGSRFDLQVEVLP